MVVYYHATDADPAKVAKSGLVGDTHQDDYDGFGYEFPFAADEETIFVGSTVSAVACYGENVFEVEAAREAFPVATGEYLLPVADILDVRLMEQKGRAAKRDRFGKH